MNFNFTKSAAVANVSSLQVNNILTNTQSIPEQVSNSMLLQGMDNSSPFNPGIPINPMNPLDSEPRQFEYRVGQNIVQRPRSTEAIGFDTMRSIIEMYDIAQMCIEVRQDELRNLDWDIVPVDESDKNATVKYSSEIKTIREFFKKPDGYTLFDDFQNQLAYDWLAYDALAVYPHLTRGGKLGSLEPVDGTTITPLVDKYGRIPIDPAPAFIQWAYGMPWVWLNRNQLIYKPHRKRTNKLYGFSPVEWLLNNINTDIRYQLYFLQYFTDGSVPASWGETPDGWSGEQIKQFQTMYDAIMTGDQSQKHKVKWVPHGANMKETKDTKFDINFPQFMLNKTCAAFKVTPAELGFTEKVNKSSGETQENVQYRRSIKPSATFFSNIYNRIISNYLQLPALKFKFLNIEEQEDMLVMAQRDDIYIKNGVLSPDEVRTQRLGLDTDEKQPVPRGFFSERDGFVPVEDAIEKSKLAIEQISNGTIQPGQDPARSTDNIVTEKAAKDFFISPTVRKK